MGYTTTLMFLNDRWHQVVNNPTLWVESIDQIFREGGTAAFQTRVMPTSHADNPRLYIMHGNTFSEFGRPDVLDEARSSQFMLDWYRENVRIARRILNDFDKQLKSIEPR